MKGVKLRGRNISLWSGTVTAEKTFLLCSQMYKILCEKLNKNNAQTTEGARHSYLVWRNLLYWWGSTEELRAPSTILVTPFQAKKT